MFGAAAVGVALTIALIVARSGPDPEPEVAGPTEPAVSSSSDVAPLSTTIVTPAADPAPSEVPADASAPPAASAPPEKTAAKLAVRSPKQTAIPKPPLAKSASPAKSAQTPPAKPPEDPFGTMQ